MTSTVDPEFDLRDDTSRAVTRWVLLTMLAVLVGSATYFYAVRTITGQTIENSALRGADQIGADASLRADGMLSQMTVGSLVAVTVVIGLIGLIRRQPRLGLAGVAIVLLGQVITQPLKALLPRPEMLDFTGSPVHNSFPSGHSTIATSIACALILLAPFRWRGVVGIVAVLAASAVSVYTVVAKWHRLSDTIGANAVAVASACLVCLILVASGRTGMRRVDDDASSGMRTFMVATLTVAAIAVCAVAAQIMLSAWRRPQLDYISADRLLLGSQLLAGSVTVVAICLFWWTLYRLEPISRRFR